MNLKDIFITFFKPFFNKGADNYGTNCTWGMESRLGFSLGVKMS